MRFNEHVRRVRVFARRATLLMWIEPLAFIAGMVLVYLAYARGLVRSWALCLVLTYVAAQLLVVVFSLLVMGSQLVKAVFSKQRQPPPVSPAIGGTGKLVHLRSVAQTRAAEAAEAAKAKARASGNAGAASPASSATAAAAAAVAEEKKGGPDASEALASGYDEAAEALEGEGRRPWSVCKRLPAVPQVVRWDIVGVTLSNWFGKVNSIPLPPAAREPMYRLYAWKTGADLSEVKLPLTSFANLQEFFSRELKDGLRPVADTPLVSPVDARIVVLGPVTSNNVEQVKGVTYPLSCFLGEDIYERIKTRKLWHCVLYLAPGDYHRIHSAADCTVSTLRHFPGTLFPISPVVARLVPNLFALNERVVLAGQWQHGFFSSTAVGAYHVGSMAFNFDRTVRTNKLRRDYRNPNLSLLSTRDLGAYAYDFSYPSIPFAKGQEVGTFKLGSTIVLVFEVPDNAKFNFAVQPGQKVRMGEKLGFFSS